MKKYDFVTVYGGEKVVAMALEAGGAASHNLTTALRYVYNRDTRRDWMRYQNAGRSVMRYRVSRVSQNGIEPVALKSNKKRVMQGLAYLLEANEKRKG